MPRLNGIEATRRILGDGQPCPDPDSHHVRRRRVRLPIAAGRGQRLPPQERTPAGTRRRRQDRRSRGSAARTRDHPPTHRELPRRPSPARRRAGTVHPHHPGTGSPRPHRRSALQRRNRHRPIPLGTDREKPRRTATRETRPPRPSPGSRVRLRERPHPTRNPMTVASRGRRSTSPLIAQLDPLEHPYSNSLIQRHLFPSQPAGAHWKHAHDAAPSRVVHPTAQGVVGDDLPRPSLRRDPHRAG